MHLAEHSTLILRIESSTNSFLSDFAQGLLPLPLVFQAIFAKRLALFTIKVIFLSTTSPCRLRQDGDASHTSAAIYAFFLLHENVLSSLLLKLLMTLKTFKTDQAKVCVSVRVPHKLFLGND